MELKSLLLPEKVVTFDFPGCEGLTFDLAFLAKEELTKIQKECTGKKLDHRTRQMADYFDDEKFLKIYVRKILRGWSGLTVRHLKELVLIDDSGVDLDDHIEFSDAAALELMQASTSLDNWISEQIGDLGKFSTPSTSKKSNVSMNISKAPAKE